LHRKLGCATLLAVALVVACGPASTPAARKPAPSAMSPDHVTVTAREYRFIMPATWHSGWAAVTLLNDGAAPHQLQLARLRSGVSSEQVRTAFLRGDARAAFAGLELVGGPDTVEPGLGQLVMVRLDPGDYLGLDLASGADGVQNVSHGMLQPFTVSGPPAGAEPSAQGDLVERSFGYAVLPIPARRVVLRVRNVSADDAHEAAIVRPESGRDIDDVLSFLRRPAGPPPFRFVGGVAGLEPGGISYLNLELDAGSYVLFCFVTDPETGRFHFDEGMIQSFTVGTPR
jgi:hypothetical protein